MKYGLLINILSPLVVEDKVNLTWVISCYKDESKMRSFIEATEPREQRC